MIDVKKTRNNFQKFPSLKQRCDPVVKPQTAVRNTKQTATTLKNNIKNPATDSATKTKSIHSTKATNATASPSKTNDRTTNSNPVREANQHFFLVQEFKDQNFLKAECELAHAQVYKPSTSENKTLHKNFLPAVVDNRRYNNSFINKFSTTNNNLPGKSAALAATINGMRRTGNGSHLGTTTAVATSINKADYSGSQFKGLSSATATSLSSSSTSSSTPGTSNTTALKKPTSVYTTTNSSYNSAKLLSRTTVKPLVHRSGATTSAASVSNSASGALSSASSSSSPNQSNNNNNNGSNSSLNSITNSGNNNMQTSLDQDDIKFIDSDEQPATGPMMSERKCEQPRCCLNHSHSSGVSKSRVRPKSTIICSTSSTTGTCSSSSSGNSLVFEKVNNYKYANGSLPSSATTDRRSETAIDSNSIRASIEKFNSYSEQKRLPLSSVTLRSHSGSGSTSNLQHHRHSSDLDNCNLRLTSGGGGGSLTRTPYRSSGSTAGKVITSIYPNASAAVSSATARHHHHHHHHALSSSPSSTGSLPLKSSKHYVQTETDSSYTGLSSSVDGDVSKKKLTSISGGLCNNTDDNSVRSSATLRSVLPPASPTSSRYYDRDSSRSALLTSSTSSHNNTDENKKSTASDEETEGLCGLRNIGNTCFMNSVIQCLSHTNELTKFLRNYNATKSPTSKDQQILYEFSKLIKEMWTNNVNSVTPMELKRSFSAKHRMYSDYNQQDAQEFLRFFLDSLHGALNSGTKGEHLKIDDNLSDNKKAELTWEWYGRHENSLIRDLFVGQLKSTLRCTTCGNSSVTFDPFWDLSVPLPSSSRCKLDACLDLFIREEVLDGDEMPTCSKCQTRRKCTKSFTIQRFPKYLVIHLKRFSETRWSKLSNIVEFPTGERELNMGPYGANANSNQYYSLYAISNHMGSTAGGHYVAICKHPVSKKWHEFNDNLVSDSLSEHHLVSSSAYILFYERA
ncbi:ubiquitin carboxyl-terminal hydrolase Usp2 isoform X1 [Lucilia sericata]|uniref:ubiquitin carboxyl-terminal hydrolase Usp2 isoform X1 n=2 Tax=Lucilia sericata TaxID=13632 RepID=UPI0018A8385D|nr:ubiquitin carboxyl-terminal hydrolase Usp2 isoform X1 [Lucilia sericata]